MSIEKEMRQSTLPLPAKPMSFSQFVGAPDSPREIKLPRAYRRGVVIVQFLPASSKRYIVPNHLQISDAYYWLEAFSEKYKQSGQCSAFYVFNSAAFQFSMMIGRAYYLEKLRSAITVCDEKEPNDHKKYSSSWNLKADSKPKPRPNPIFEFNVKANPNIECIFNLEDAESRETFLVHLRRFANDDVPKLPDEVVPISGDSPLGEALIQWGKGKEVRNKDKSKALSFHYRVVSRTPYEVPSHPVDARQTHARIKSIAPLGSVDEHTDNAKHANGHLAREEKGWGSIPMHDSYGDESTGQERDFEDYAEYSANYTV